METKTAGKSSESSFERQLKRGFKALRFQDRLEQQYRLQHVTEITPVVRISLLAGLLFVGILAALDYKLFPAEFHRWSIGIRLVIMAPAIVLGLLLTSGSKRPRLLATGGAIVGLAVGLGSLWLGAIGMELGLPSLFSGYLVVTFYVYFLLGLLFWQALIIALLLAGAFLASGLLGGLPIAQLAYNGLFLGFSNLIGIIGLYTLERTGRLNFLRTGILEGRVGYDALTGLRNRHAFDEYLDSVWRICKRDKKPIALMMIDIDYFKNYNDIYGHQAGDKCLQNVASVFNPIARRPLDFVARYGGEEFVVILHGSIEQYARESAEGIRAQVEKLQLPHRESAAGKVVTVSVGLAYLMPHETKRSPEGFLQLADEALYEAKERGRNQVVVSEGGNKGIQTGIFRRELGKA